MDILGSAMDILDMAADQLSGAIKLESQVFHLKLKITSLLTEKVEDQKLVIDLQSQLIKKKDQELTLVQATVQNEVRSYASIVQ